MSGIFGFFDYSKEGPGVYKDGPKKRGFVVFFETFFRNFWKFIIVNCAYSIISVPIITNGLAKVGITNIARNTAREKHSFGLTDFFETIKKNFKQSLIAGIINAVVFGLLGFDIYFFQMQKGSIGIVGVGIALALFVTFLMMNFYLWTLIITFDYSLKQAYSISFKLAFLNFKYSFLIILINILLIALSVGLLFLTGKAWVVALIFELFVLFTVYPGFNALLIQFCTFPAIKKFIIDPYYQKHPDADIEKRRSLGLLEETVEETKTEEIAETEEEDDSIFND